MAGHVDFETYSEIDLTTVGAYRYAEHASTEPLIISYSLDGKEVIGVDLTNPKEHKKLERLFNAVEQGLKLIAHHAGFERNIWEKICVKRYDWPKVKSYQWECTAVRASALCIPRTLEGGALALKLDVAKDPLGKTLINRFSRPDRKGNRVRSTDDPQGFKKFVEYCCQDTVVETALDEILPHLSRDERELFHLDFRINDYGVPLDVPLIRKALDYVDEYTNHVVKECQKLTGGLRPSQRDKLLGWMQDQGTGLETLQAEEIQNLIDRGRLSSPIEKVLRGRIEIVRAGTKKLKTMLDCVSPDGRVRGSFMFWSASTGRWGSTGVQFHNLAKPEKRFPQEEVLDLLQLGGLELFYDQPLSAIAKSVRGFVMAPDGREFLIADYSAVEARALAWIADEEFILRQYRQGRDVYKAMASRIFRVPYDQITDDQRFFGKTVILGAGYGLGWLRLIESCAEYGVQIDEATAKKIIRVYRESVPNIVRFWSTIERAALRAVLTGKKIIFANGRLSFHTATLKNGFEVLYLTLPSGRRISYPEPRIENLQKFGKLVPTLIFKTYYRGMWVDEETWGGKLTENAIQAICRDLMAEGMKAVDRAGLPIVLHVHDEIGSEVDKGQSSVKEFEQLVCRSGSWAEGLPLAAEGKRLKRYAK